MVWAVIYESGSMRPGASRFALAMVYILSNGLHNMLDLMGKYGLDLCPQGPKGLGPRNIDQGLGLGFTRVLPWAPENRPQGPGLGRAGAWAGLGPGWPIKARAGNESKEN